MPRFETVASLKKLQADKPDSVSLSEALAKEGFGLSFICSQRYRRDSSCLPCTLGEQPSKRYYTWHFSMQGLPGSMITHKTCELLPHIFTLSLLAPPLHKVERGLGGEVIFCGTVCLRQVGARLFTGALLCAVRTFLLSWKRRSDSLACSGSKNKQ